MENIIYIDILKIVGLFILRIIGFFFVCVVVGYLLTLLSWAIMYMYDKKHKNNDENIV